MREPARSRDRVRRCTRRRSGPSPRLDEGGVRVVEADDARHELVARCAQPPVQVLGRERRAVAGGSGDRQASRPYLGGRAGTPRCGGQISQRVTGSWVTVTGKRREGDLDRPAIGHFSRLVAAARWCGPSSPGWRSAHTRCRALKRPRRARRPPGPLPGGGGSPAGDRAGRSGLGRQWPPGCLVVQPQTLGCGSPEAYWFHSRGVGGPASAQSTA
jgi:hypothetical protein